MRTHIDGEIAQLEDRIVKLRRRRNQLAPISRLPVDVLQFVMLNLLPSEPCAPEMWIQFTLVSHNWRAVALDCPLLWRTIDLSNMSMNWVDEFIRRSRGVPLVLRSNCNTALPADLTKVTSALTGALDRISGLFVLSGGYEQTGWIPLLNSLDFFKSPCFESLEVWQCKRLYLDWKSTFRLRYLTLKYNSFNAALFSPHLTSLTLKDIDHESLPSRSEFYELLASLTNLRSLTLRNVLTGLTTDTGETIYFPLIAVQATIFLPSLHRLDLCDESEQECARFLSHTAFPNLVGLFTSLNKATPTSLTILSGVLPRIWNNTLILNRTLDHSKKPYLHMQAFVDGSYNALRVLNPFEKFSIETNISWISDSCIQPFCDVIATLPGDRDGQQMSIPDLWITWTHPSQDDFASLTRQLAKSPCFKSVRFSIPGGAQSYFTLLKSCTPYEYPNRCVQNSATKHFSRQLVSLTSDSPACASCQGHASAFFPNLDYLKVHVDTTQKVDREVLEAFLAHRFDCGRPRKFEGPPLAEEWTTPGMGNETIGTLDAERAQIDSEIAQLQAQITKLCRRRNQLAPIMQLPQDVLQLIMLNLLPSSQCSPATWTQFTQVSYYLRTLALDYPLLWTTIDLSVCRQLGLSAVTSMLVGAMDRIRAFQCTTIDKEAYAGWFSSLNSLDFSKSSCFEDLEIWHCKELYQDWKLTLKLRYLNLRFGVFNASLFSPHLTDLTLKDPDPATLPTTSEFYHILASLTNLRVLTLRKLLVELKTESETESGVPSFFLNTEASAILPRLHSLSLYDKSDQTCARLLSHVVHSSLEILNVSLDKSTASTLSALTEVLPRVWRNSLIFNRGPRYSKTPYLHLQVDVEGSYNALRLLDSNDAFRIETYISWTSDSGDQPFRDLVATLPGEQLLTPTLWIHWKHRPLEDFLALLSALQGFSCFKSLGVPFSGDSRWCFDLLKYGTPNDCPNNCVGESTSKAFSCDASPPSPLPACASCQEFAASFFPNMDCLIVRVDAPQKVEREVLERFLAHRFDSGQPMRSVRVKCKEYLTEEGKVAMAELQTIGDVIECYV
ncbi:hypothetical protein AX16_001514 [Volvariella volvacea WC 439]|nr:hypothetical protein AX16_001514 [Volvariella volvacea WC 439]